MSLYPLPYESGSKGELLIEDMKDGHLHNAAMKLRAKVDAGDATERETAVVEYLEREVRRREEQRDAAGEGA